MPSHISDAGLARLLGALRSAIERIEEDPSAVTAAAVILVTEEGEDSHNALVALSGYVDQVEEVFAQACDEAGAIEAMH